MGAGRPSSVGSLTLEAKLHTFVGRSSKEVASPRNNRCAKYFPQSMCVHLFAAVGLDVYPLRRA